MSTGTDWRDLDGEGGAVSRNDAWQRLEAGDDEDLGQKPWSRTAKFTMVGLALAAVVVAGVIIIQWLKPPRPACILLVGARYDTNLLLPPNVLGWNGLEDIKKWTGQHAVAQTMFFWKDYKGMRPSATSTITS